MDDFDIQSRFRSHRTYRPMQRCLETEVRSEGRGIVHCLILLGLIATGLLLAPPPTSAIIGGRNAEAGKWGWNVGLFLDIQKSVGCGGSLIARTWVLTAAHCLQGVRLSNVFALLGTHDSTSGELTTVSIIHIHPDYDGNRRNDIALLKLSTSAPASLGSVSLPNEATHARIAAPGTTTTALGWGLTDASSVTSGVSDLQQVALTLKSASECASAAVFGSFFSSTAHLCTETQGKSVCAGDSGGPLVVTDQGTDYQVGITSYAEQTRPIPCRKAGFTRVASYRDWIDLVTGPPTAAPTGLAAVPDSGMVTLQWDDPGDPLVTGYEVRSRPEDGTYNVWTAIPAGDVRARAHAVTGLTNGREYAFQVRPVNDGGTGPKAGIWATPRASVDAMPTFGTATVADQGWVKNMTIEPLVLPAAVGGDGVLSYRLTPATLPSGLSFDSTARTISGTPSVNRGATDYTWTATDADGDPVSLVFSVSVGQGICDRTRLVQEAIISRVRWVIARTSDEVRCDQVTGVHLRLITYLDGLVNEEIPGIPGISALRGGDFFGLSSLPAVSLDRNPLTSLPADLFAGARSLRNLSLSYNRLSALPAGIFDGLNLTDGLLLHGNTASPLPLNVVAERIGSQARAYLAQAAPRAVRVTWTATGGSTATGTAIIPAGQRYSAPFGAAAAQAVTITLSAPALDGVSESTSDGSGSYSGFQLAVPSASASVTIPGAPVDLGSLAISQGTLDPAFAADRTAYAASVGNAVTSVDITPTVSDPSMATLTVNGVAVTSGTAHSVPLAVGENTIAVVVAEQGGTATKTYTLTVTRAPSSVAELSGLTLSDGTLSPAFAAGEIAYTAEVAHTVTSLTLTPTAADRDHATITVSGVPAFSGDPSDGVDLRVGANAVPIVVTAQDGTTKEYTVTVTRQARPVVPPPPPDRQPSFEDAAVAAQRYMVGTAITPLVLPAATGGDPPLSYALTSALPVGLSFDARTREVAGTPLEANAEASYTLTATDMDGDTATLAFTIEVVPDLMPTFGDAVVKAQRYRIGTPVALPLPAAMGGDGALSYRLAPELPVGLSFDNATRSVSGTPAAEQAATTYTWTATDEDGDTASLTFTVEVLEPIIVSISEADAFEGGPIEFKVGLSIAAESDVTVTWTTTAGTATPEEDYRHETGGRLRIPAGRTEAPLRVQTLEDRYVEPPETFTVTLLDATNAKLGANSEAMGTITDNDTEAARHRALGMVLAGVGRTISTDAVDVIGGRFEQQLPAVHATLGGQTLSLQNDTEAGQWGRVAGLAYGVAQALGMEVVSPLAGPVGSVGDAAWDVLARAATARWDSPLSEASDFRAASVDAWNGQAMPNTAAWSPGGYHGHRRRPDQASGGRTEAPVPGAGLGQRRRRGISATLDSAFQSPVRFRRVSAMKMLSRSRFEVPLGTQEAEGWMSGWTLWGRGTPSGFNGEPKDDFSMAGDVFTGYLGLDYRLQQNVLLGLAVAHSRGDVGYETTDVTEGEMDIGLTSVLPYAHWSPRPGLGVWGLFGAGWGDVELTDEAGKGETDLEMLMAAVGARQELLTWRRIDLALKADAFLAELEAESKNGLPKTAGDAQRLRLMLEGRTAWATSEGAQLTPSFEVGGRWDGGKAETGVGAELGGGLEYRHVKLGLGIEARGRYLLVHQQSAFDEWGASLTLKLDPGEAERGPWLALAPVWGTEASRIEQMWDSADVLHAGAGQSDAAGLSPERLEVEWGYGLVIHEGAGMVTPYGGVSLGEPWVSGYRLGGRVEVSEAMDLSVEGERRERPRGTAQYGLTLRGHLHW